MSGTNGKNGKFVRMNPEERFWSKVNKTDTCWLWTGAKYYWGYGNFFNGTKSVRAHRWIWEKVNGPIPKGMLICHKCDVPACVKPDHLFIGTISDNSQDMMKKKRNPSHIYKDRWVKNTAVAVKWAKDNRHLTFGELSTSNKLKNQQVLDILKAVYVDKISRYVVARQYGVGYSTVQNITCGLTWNHGIFKETREKYKALSEYEKECGE